MQKVRNSEKVDISNGSKIRTSAKQWQKYSYQLACINTNLCKISAKFWHQYISRELKTSTGTHKAKRDRLCTVHRPTNNRQEKNVITKISII